MQVESAARIEEARIEWDAQLAFTAPTKDNQGIVGHQDDRMVIPGCDVSDVLFLTRPRARLAGLKEGQEGRFEHEIGRFGRWKETALSKLVLTPAKQSAVTVEGEGVKGTGGDRDDVCQAKPLWHQALGPLARPVAQLPIRTTAPAVDESLPGQAERVMLSDRHVHTAFV